MTGGEIALPPALEPGVAVGVIAPSSPPRAELLDGTIAYWEGRGHPVVVGEHVRASVGGYLAGSAAERADDVNRMIRDPNVALIVPAMGGKGASQLLEHLDYDALVAAPKLLMGLSDASLLMLAIHARTGMVTFHGPTGMDFGELHAYSERHMLAALTSTDAIGPLDPHGTWSALRTGPPTQGRLLGGHLGTIRALVGTPYEPDWHGALLFIEEIDAELHDVDASLTHLRLAGVLDRIAALVVGRPVNVAERWRESEEELSDVVLRCCAGYDFPILYDVDLGHTAEKVTLPVGALATVATHEPALSLDEPAVKPARGSMPRVDLDGLVTEGIRPSGEELDAASTPELVELMIEDVGAVQGALSQAAGEIAAAIDAIAERMAQGGRLIYLGAGTSGRLAVLDAAECGPTFNTAPDQVQALLAGGIEATEAAREAAEDDGSDAVRRLRDVGVRETDVVFGLSASGRTPFVLAGMEEARRVGALAIGASCNAETPLSAAVDLSIEIPVGPELLAGSTRLKCGTAQKVMLNAVSTIVMIRLGKTYRNLMVDLRPTNAKLVERAVRIIRAVTDASDEASRAALAACGNDVKAAIVTLVRSLTPSEAKALLDEHGGHLRSAIKD